jgi:hypothetical protein
MSLMGLEPTAFLTIRPRMPRPLHTHINSYSNLNYSVMFILARFLHRVVKFLCDVDNGWLPLKFFVIPLFAKQTL